MERPIFQQENVTVTKTRFIVGSQTYAVRNITSVRPIKVPPPQAGATVVTLCGPLVGIMIYISLGLLWGCVIGFILFAIGIWMFTKQRPSYGVLLTTSSGELRALVDPRLPFILGIVDGINEAIVGSSD